MADRLSPRNALGPAARSRDRPLWPGPVLHDDDDDDDDAHGTASRDSVPEPSQVDAFVAVCNKFRAQHPDEYIGRAAVVSGVADVGRESLSPHLRRCCGACARLTPGVHCTHGFNRTGYMICMYMYRELGFAMDVAIAAFAECR